MPRLSQYDDDSLEAQRKCLSCNKMFLSKHKANRICPQCLDKQRKKLQLGASGGYVSRKRDLFKWWL